MGTVSKNLAWHIALDDHGKEPTMKRLHAIPACLTLALALAACNQPGITPPGGSTVTQAEAVDTASAVNDDIASSIGTLTVGGAVSYASLGSVTAASLNGISAQVAPKPCVTVTPNPIVDTDKDGVPDNATYTFDCSRDGVLSASSKTGTLQISDPSSVAGVWGFDSSINLTESSTNKLKGITVTDVRTGSRSPRKTGDQIVQSHNITTKRSVTGKPDATIQNQWNLTFAATTAGSIVMGSPLPAGSIQLAGSYSFSRDGKTRTWTASTPTPLGYDPACTADLKIVSGKLVLTLSGPNGGGTMEVVYNACGTEPTITRTPADPATPAS
jgi:hypothetical protein